MLHQQSLWATRSPTLLLHPCLPTFQKTTLSVSDPRKTECLSADEMRLTRPLSDPRFSGQRTAASDFQAEPFLGNSGNISWSPLCSLALQAASPKNATLPGTLLVSFRSTLLSQPCGNGGMVRREQMGVCPFRASPTCHTLTALECVYSPGHTTVLNSGLSAPIIIPLSHRPP